MNKKWYAVYTKPRWEKKVAEALADLEVENYCPLNKVQRQWSDRKKIVMEPLFTSYVFVNIPDNMLSTVRTVNGVLNFVYWLSKPAIIKDEEIITIKRFLSEHETVRLEKCDVKINDMVRVIDGAFLHEEGNVIEVKNNAVKVILPSLGATLVAEIKRTHIEVSKKFASNVQIQVSKQNFRHLS